MKSFKTHIVHIIEDQVLIGRSLQNFINAQSNYACTHHFTDANSCMDTIINNLPHIIICDIGLPGMNGVECMELILKSYPEIKFIMFTVFDTDEFLFSALQKGASGYLLKDDPYPDIVQAITDVLNGGGAMSPAIAKKVITSFKTIHKNITNNNSIEILTNHQQNILTMIAQGLLNKEIASKLDITEGTVKIQISTIYKKLQVNNRVEAVNYLNRRNQ